MTHDELECASILTLGTFGIKSAIDIITKGMEDEHGNLVYSMDDANHIKSRLIVDGVNVIIPETLAEEHEILFKHVNNLFGVIQGVGRHAAGVVVSTRDLDAEMGTMTVTGWDFKVTQLNMKLIDKLNWVKLDVLALDSLELINRTAKFAGLPRPNPDSEYIDFQDKDVWESTQKDNTTLAQFTGVRAGKILSDILSEATLNNIRKENPDFSYVDLVALASAAQRPSGESYVENVQNGFYKDNGHESLNELFKDTMGYMVYQEQLTKFLVEMCGWTGSQADLIRRGMSKKEPAIMNEEVPKIKPSFIKTMVEKYGDTKEHAESVADAFIQIFMDAVNYGFNKSHAVGYAYLTSIQAWLRHYYPLEYCTVALDLYKDDLEKTKQVLDMAERHGIKIEDITFRYSKGEYFFDRETNSIYQGTSPIKGNNAETGDMLYEMRDMEFDSFTDFLLHVKDGTSIVLDGRKYSLQDIFSMSQEEMSDIDDKVAKATKYKDFDPYQDKTIKRRFATFMNKLSPHDHLAMRLEKASMIEDEEERDVFIKNKIFKEWLDKYDKGKKPWLEDLSDLEVIGEPVPINKTKMLSLINLGYFREFGSSKVLAQVFHMFNDSYKPSNKKYKPKAEVYNRVKHFEKTTEQKEYSIVEKIEFQDELLGRITLSAPQISPRYAYVASILNEGKTRTTALVYIINKGVYQEVKVGTKLYRNVPFKEKDLIKIDGFKTLPKVKRIQGEYVKSETEQDLWVTEMSVIKFKD